MKAKFKPDWIAAIIVALLVTTLAAYFSGWFPYPYGWIVLGTLLLFRLSAIRQKEQE